MIAFSFMLESAAKNAGINVPPNVDEYTPSKYIKWHVFQNQQLGIPMSYPGVHFDNAKVIAKFTDDELKSMSIGELRRAGFS